MEVSPIFYAHIYVGVFRKVDDASNQKLNLDSYYFHSYLILFLEKIDVLIDIYYISTFLLGPALCTKYDSISSFFSNEDIAKITLAHAVSKTFNKLVAGKPGTEAFCALVLLIARRTGKCKHCSNFASDNLFRKVLFWFQIYL